MEQEYLTKFMEGIRMFMDMANWPFTAFFMIWTVILNMTVGKSIAKKNNKVTSWIKQVPKAYWVILQGVILAGLWAYFFRYSTREDVAGLLFSITIAMVIYKMGIQKAIYRKAEK